MVPGISQGFDLDGGGAGKAHGDGVGFVHRFLKRFIYVHYKQ